MCLFYMYFRQENTLQSNMVIVRFSPKTVSPPRCYLMLPLRARATVMSTCFFHARAIEKFNILEARTIQCIAVWVHLSIP